MSLSSPSSVAQSTVAPPRASRREIFAWALYDWANSGYSTLSITLLMSYMTGVLNHQWGARYGELAWGWGLGVTMFVAALLSPVLGAVADAQANKRGWLAVTALAGAAASCLMFLATPDRPTLLFVLFLVANLGMELSQGFYNAFLPELADEHSMGRVSSWGFALGYLGGGLVLLAFLMLYKFAPKFGLPDDDPTSLVPRLGLLMMGAWWAVFTLPAIIVLRDRGTPRSDSSLVAAARRAVGEVRGTLTNLRRYRVLVIFLLGFLVFNDGVQTVISQAGVFAKDVLSMDAGELALVVLMIQFIALPGAIVVGWIGDRIGQMHALHLCLAVWTVLLVASFFVNTTAQFWIMSAVAALVLGGTQSVSRTIMGLMTPEAHTGEFFGFFNLSGKATSMFGPVVYSTVFFTTHSAHLAIASLLLFLVVGWAIVSRVDVNAGRREALKGERPSV
ncbi:MAG TPA: MFS transporter [Pirellulales bacterium]|jgi:UMF1 family MFS transporter|nr:MFS transporter [Pirellulales bacterium]